MHPLQPPAARCTATATAAHTTTLSARSRQGHGTFLIKIEKTLISQGQCDNLAASPYDALPKRNFGQKIIHRYSVPPSMVFLVRRRYPARTRHFDVTLTTLISNAAPHKKFMGDDNYLTNISSLLSQLLHARVRVSYFINWLCPDHSWYISLHY